MSGQDHAHHDHGHAQADSRHQHHRPAESFEALRTKAIESLLIEKGILSSALVDEMVRNYEQDTGPLRGAQIVARAWLDPAFRERLLADGTGTVAEYGFVGHELKVVENTPQVHNMIVCTLCSCYPWAVLGLPPTWYKNPAYRSRAVIEPRAVLREFGLELPESVEIRVWDSNAELRYMVLPVRPAGTEGWTQEELAGIVTRDAMIGVAQVTVPARAGSRP